MHTIPPTREITSTMTRASGSARNAVADGFQHEEIEVDHTGQLAERETHGQPVAYIHGHVQDEHEQGEIEHGHQGLEGTVRRYGSTKLPYRLGPVRTVL